MADVRNQSAVKIVDPTTDANGMGVDASGHAQMDLAAISVSDLDIRDISPAQDELVAYAATDLIYNANTALTPKFAAIAAATSGDNTLVAAVSGKKIRVLALAIIAGAAGNIYFTSAAGGTVIFGGSTNKIQLAANGGFVLPFNPVGWMENSSTNQLLNMNASSTGPFSGGLVYVEV
jgi:hypothetical protein